MYFKYIKMFFKYKILLFKFGLKYKKMYVYNNNCYLKIFI